MDRLLIVTSTLFLFITLIINKCDANPVQKRSSSCKENEFKCREDHSCIPNTWVCDYSYDCHDRSDEESCPGNLETTVSPVKEPCAEEEFQCISDGICISSSWVCDKSLDCYDKSDESDCFSVQCKPNETRCKETGHCIDFKWLCDGESDCLDNSDEAECPQVQTTTQLYLTETTDNEEINTSSNIDLESNHSEENISHHINKSSSVESKKSSNFTEERFGEVSTDQTEDSENLTFILDNKNIVEFGLHSSLSEFELDYFLPVNSNQNIARLLSEPNNETSTIFSDDILFAEDYDIQTTTPKNFEYEDYNAIPLIKLINDGQSRLATKLPEITSTTEQELINLNSTILFTYSNDPSLNDSAKASSIDSSDSTVYISTTFDTTEANPATTTTTTWTTIATTTAPTTTLIPTPTTTLTTTSTTTPTTTTTMTTTTTPTTTTTTTTPSTTTPYPCVHGEFFCRSDSSCIPVEWRCDHTQDCWDGSDEENCDEVRCPDHMVQCPDTGQCIFYAWICDGNNDCDTGSDERHCP